MGKCNYLILQIFVARGKPTAHPRKQRVAVGVWLRCHWASFRRHPRVPTSARWTRVLRYLALRYVHSFDFGCV